MEFWQHEAYMESLRQTRGREFVYDYEPLNEVGRRRLAQYTLDQLLALQASMAIYPTLADDRRRAEQLLAARLKSCTLRLADSSLLCRRREEQQQQQPIMRRSTSEDQLYVTARAEARRRLDEALDRQLERSVRAFGAVECGRAVEQRKAKYGQQWQPSPTPSDLMLMASYDSDVEPDSSSDEETVICVGESPPPAGQQQQQKEQRKQFDDQRLDWAPKRPKLWNRQRQLEELWPNDSSCSKSTRRRIDFTSDEAVRAGRTDEQLRSEQEELIAELESIESMCARRREEDENELTVRWLEAEDRVEECKRELREAEQLVLSRRRAYAAALREKHELARELEKRTPAESADSYRRRSSGKRRAPRDL